MRKALPKKKQVPVPARINPELLKEVNKKRVAVGLTWPQLLENILAAWCKENKA